MQVGIQSPRVVVEVNVGQFLEGIEFNRNRLLGQINSFGEFLLRQNPNLGRPALHMRGSVSKSVAHDDGHNESAHIFNGYFVKKSLRACL